MFPRGRSRWAASRPRPARRSRSFPTRRSSTRPSSTPARSSRACARPRSSRRACASASPTSASAARRSSSSTRAASRTSSLHQRVEGHRAQARRLLRERDRPGRGRGRDAVEQLLPGVGLLVRQQHQHARGRLAPLRVQGRADAHAERLRAREGAAEGEGGQPRRRGRSRRARGGDQREARPTRSSRGRRRRSSGTRGCAASSSRPSTQKLAEFFEENPHGRAPDHQQGDLGSACAPGRPQGARADAAQVGARVDVAAGQARRLLDQRSVSRRALHRRGRQRRRLGQDGPRPHLPGDPAAAREDHQLREEPHQQGSLEQRDPGDDHRDRHRPRRRVRPREAPLPPHDRHDGRRRRRVAHPHADPDVPVPADAGADRGRATSTSRSRRSTR